MDFLEEKEILTNLEKEYKKILSYERLDKLIFFLPWVEYLANINNPEAQSLDEREDERRRRSIALLHRYSIPWGAVVALSFPINIGVLVLKGVQEIVGSFEGKATGSKDGRIIPIKKLLEIITIVENIEKKYSTGTIDLKQKKKILQNFNVCRKSIENLINMFSSFSDNGERFELLISVANSIDNKMKLVLENAPDEIKSVNTHSMMIAQGLRSHNSLFFKLPIETAGIIAAYSVDGKGYFQGKYLEDVAVGIISCIQTKKNKMF